jgi:hypothetical protein
MAGMVALRLSVFRKAVVVVFLHLDQKFTVAEQCTNSGVFVSSFVVVVSMFGISLGVVNYFFGVYGVVGVFFWGERLNRDLCFGEPVFLHPVQKLPKEQSKSLSLVQCGKKPIHIRQIFDA